MLYLRVICLALLAMALGSCGSYTPQALTGDEAASAAIVGTWEFVEVTGSHPDVISLSEFFQEQELTETFYADGTGLSFGADGEGLHFTWAITDNRLIIDFQWPEYVDMPDAEPMIFEIRDTYLITYSEYILDYHYPDGRWIFRRVN